MHELRSILKSKESMFNVTFDQMQLNAAMEAMTDYAIRAVTHDRQSENKAAIKEAVKLFPALWKGDIILWLRRRSFLKVKKQAQINADLQNRPFYIVRSTRISYVMQSTLNVDNLKRRRIYRKDVTAMKMQKIADWTVYPTKPCAKS